MPLPEREVHDLVDEWIESRPDSVSRVDAARRLGADPLGRAMLTAHRILARPPVGPETDLSAGVMARLPSLSPQVCHDIADLVLRAWAEPGLRRALRAAPAAVLAREGIGVPASMRIEVVSAIAQARLPTPERLVLCLPADDEPACNPDDARRRLAVTPFAWLWGPPWSRPGASPGVVMSARSGATTHRWGWWGALPGVWRSATLGLGAAALLLILYLALAPPGRDMPLAGAAGAVDRPEGVVLAAAAGVVVLVYLLVRFRR